MFTFARPLSFPAPIGLDLVLLSEDELRSLLAISKLQAKKVKQLALGHSLVSKLQQRSTGCLCNAWEEQASSSPTDRWL